MRKRLIAEQWDPVITLGLDVATRTGFGLVEAGATAIRRVASGRWDLDEGEPELGARMLRLWKRLDEIRAECIALHGGLDLVAHESMGHYKQAHTTLVCVGLIAHVHTWCYRRSIPVVDVKITDVKMLATGRGRADKQESIAGAERLFGYRPHNGDEADALLVAHIACTRAMESTTP